MTSRRTIPEYPVLNFTQGLITEIEAESIKNGASSDSLNWVSKGDHIELRGGQTVMGNNITGVGKITGLLTSKRFDGTEITHRTRLRKIEWYDGTVGAETWTEIGSDTLPASASAEDVSIQSYLSLAGAFHYISSPNSSIYKVPLANPTSITDLVSTSFRGKIKIMRNSMYLWQRKDTNGGEDQTGVFRGKIDKDELSDFTQVTGETGFAGVVDSVNKTYTIATLAAITGSALRTVMYVSVAATTAVGTETFRDNRSGTLTSNFGGTGTINYATGAISVTFFNAPSAGNVTADYYWENAASGGIADFAKSTPRVAGEGFVVRQDDGGSTTQYLAPFGENTYCLHLSKTYKLSVTSDDSTATNLPYRDQLGIPYHRAAIETAEGIYYVDVRDKERPIIGLMTYNQLNTELQPDIVSKQLNLKSYTFDAACVYEWNEYICVACKSSGATANDTVFTYNRKYKCWDKMDFRVSVFSQLNGVLIGGDSASYNVFQLFSGVSDEDVEIPNNWDGAKTDFGIGGAKLFNIFEVWGLIDPDQDLEVWMSYDQGEFVKVATIEGDASYVDSTQSITVGSSTDGSLEIGGGGSGIEASPYRREFRVNTPNFEKVTVRFSATKVGYVSVSGYKHKDIRAKSRHTTYPYVSN